MWLNKENAWNDIRIIFRLDFTNTVHRIVVYSLASGDLRFEYKAGGTTVTVDAAQSEAGTWIHAGMTWDTGADEMKAYVDGSQVGSTQNGLFAPGGDLSLAVIGANDLAPTTVWEGWLALAGLWAGVALTGEEMAALAEV